MTLSRDFMTLYSTSREFRSVSDDRREPRIAIREGGRLPAVLAQESFEFRIEADRLVDLGIGSSAIRAKPDQLLHVAIDRKQPPRLADRRPEGGAARARP